MLPTNTAPLLTQVKGSGGPPSVLQRGWIRRGLAILFMLAGASLLTWKLRVNKQLPCPYCMEASFVGWLYFLMWTISFYPQLLANFRRKSVEGLSLDFILMNIAGFTCYTVYNLALFTSPTVQAEYKQRFQTTSIPVELNDVLFGIHALLLSVVMAIQCMIYPKSSMQKVSLGTSLGLSVTGVLGLAYVGVLAVRGESDVPWTWLDLCYYCSFVKMGVTLVKYIPQVHLNHTRQSTDGWSIDNVLLDMGGGILSTTQLLINCYILLDWTAVTGNPIKFALGLTSMVFDLVFMLQHYVWFRRKPAVVVDASGLGYQQLPEAEVVVLIDTTGSQLPAGVIVTALVRGWLTL